MIDGWLMGKKSKTPEYAQVCTLFSFSSMTGEKSKTPQYARECTLFSFSSVILRLMRTVENQHKNKLTDVKQTDQGQ